MGIFIDVSEHNSIDWSRAKSVVDYAYIRCGVRGSLAKMYPKDYKKIRFDKKWKENVAGCQKNGIPFGPYYFPTAVTDAEALEGAKWFYEQIKDLKMSLPPMLDSENVWGKNREAGRANSLSKAERTRLLKIVTDYFNARGMNIGIYASATWFTSHLDMSKFPQCVIDCTWVADSTGAVDYNGYYWLHQYGKTEVTGCGEVDVNKIVGKIPAVKKGATVTTQPKQNPIDVTIQIAESYVGTHEGANNKTIFGDTMHALQPSNMDKNAPWCDAFVDFCIYKMCQRFGYGAETARQVLCGDFDDYTYASVAIYKKAGRWFSTPKRGDQIFFGGSGHTGIVTSATGGIVNTIEGNKGDAVRRCSYGIHSPSIIGYGRPKYELIGGTVIPESEEYDMPQIQRGSKGKAVKILQIILGDLEVDGSFGPATQAATLAFQKKHGLEADGVVGPLTWRALLDTL